jgi:hypothetical protein
LKEEKSGTKKGGRPGTLYQKQMKKISLTACAGCEMTTRANFVKRLKRNLPKREKGILHHMATNQAKQG